MQRKSGVLGHLKALDAFPKVGDDFFRTSGTGGLMTLIAITSMVILFFTELRKCSSTGLQLS